MNDTLAGSGIVWVHGGGSLEGLVSLTGSFNQLVIEDSSTFNATIAAWQPNQNTIDLLDIQFAAGSTSLSYAQNGDNTGGALTVTDGIHSATLHLLGQYSAANFQLSADKGQGGTLITEVVAPAQIQLAAALAG